MHRYWVIAPVESEPPELFDKVWNFDVANNLISIGWSGLGDVSKMSREELSDVLASSYPDKPQATKSLIGNIVWAFYHEIAPGDFLIARRGRKTLVAVGHVIQSAVYAPGKNPAIPHRNFLEVKWHEQPRDKIFPGLVFPMHTLTEISEAQHQNLMEGSGTQSTIRTPNMSDKEELEFENPLEENVESIEVPSDRRKIYTDLGDPEVESLHGKFKRGRLIVQPDFQRQFVWDTTKASRLIESALLAIPIPVVYISQEQDNIEYVIDGQQRLTSFFSFIDGSFPDGADFRLTGLKVFRELNGTKYSNLPMDVQDVIRHFKIRTITFKKDSNQDLKFEIFERLNTGSVSLNDQELRNCIYRGGFNALLKELSIDPDFTFLLGLKRPDKRMKDIELVLRFSAFYHSTYLNYKPPMKNFLNAEADKYRNIGKDGAHQLRTAFKNTCQIIRSMLRGSAFKRFHKGTDKNPTGYWEPAKFNASLYDILMYTFAREDKNVVYQNLDSIREALIHLMTENQEFIDAIELSTSSLQAVTKRFDLWRLTLQDIIGIGKKEPRCFSMQLKEALFTSDNTCAICAQKIQEVDDSAVDHIKQYWTGGKTIPENARLVHRYCNWARSRID